MARSTKWEDQILEATVASAAITLINLMADLNESERPGLTLIRLIYRINFYPVSPFDTSTIQGLHMGVGLVQNDAFAAGAVPDPGEDQEAPSRGWVVRDQGLTVSEAGDTPTIGEMKGDIRAMRKFYQDSTIMLALRSDVEVGTAQTLNVFGLVRMLFKNQ